MEKRIKKKRKFVVKKVDLGEGTACGTYNIDEAVDNAKKGKFSKVNLNKKRIEVDPRSECGLDVV